MEQQLLLFTNVSLLTLEHALIVLMLISLLTIPTSLLVPISLTMFAHAFVVALHVRQRLSGFMNALFFLTILLPNQSCNLVNLTALTSHMVTIQMEWLIHVIQYLQAGLHALPFKMNLVWIVTLVTIRLCQLAATYVLMSNNISVSLMSAAPHANLNG